MEAVEITLVCQNAVILYFFICIILWRKKMTSPTEFHKRLFALKLTGRGWDVCFKINKARVGCFKRTASKHVYHLGWNRSPAQVGCMRQVLGPGALGRPRGSGWRGRWEGGSGLGIHVNPWLIHANVWQNPLQYCKVISLQKKKINNPTLEHSVLQRIASFPVNSQLVCMSTLYYFMVALG